MNSSKIEISGVQVRWNLMTSVISLIIAAIAFMNVTKHSNIRNVDILVISGLGGMIAVFIVNLVLLLKINKQKSPAGTGY